MKQRYAKASQLPNIIFLYMYSVTKSSLSSGRELMIKDSHRLFQYDFHFFSFVQLDIMIKDTQSTDQGSFNRLESKAQTVFV